jgi:hypothetical protein
MVWTWKMFDLWQGHKDKWLRKTTITALEKLPDWCMIIVIKYYQWQQHMFQLFGSFLSALLAFCRSLDTTGFSQLPVTAWEDKFPSQSSSI